MTIITVSYTLDEFEEKEKHLHEPKKHGDKSYSPEKEIKIYKAVKLSSVRSQSYGSKMNIEKFLEVTSQTDDTNTICIWNSCGEHGGCDGVDCSCVNDRPDCDCDKGCPSGGY